MGQLEKAEHVLKEGLELDPSNEALKKELEAVMNAIAERMARQRESLECKEKAIEAFNEQVLTYDCLSDDLCLPLVIYDGLGSPLTASDDL
jgi:tetratricopeptide (TPR) repeat protein